MITTSARPLLLLLWLAGYALALSQGQLQLPALPVLGLLLMLGLMARQPRLSWLGHGGFVLLGLGLAVHALPGFDSARVFDHAVLSPGAVPYSMALNLDKPLIGLWLLLFCPWVSATRAPGRTIGVALSATLLCAALLFALALALQMVSWAPKWPEQRWLWLANNLLLVCITEELLFRGYLQAFLQSRLQHLRGGHWLALASTALLFGLGHVGAGWAWVMLATVAGVAYGLAWRHGGLLAAVACHGLINVLHFLLFTYPARL